MVALPKLLLLWTALFMLIIGLPGLFTPAATKKVFLNAVKNPEVIRVWGFAALLFGFLFLLVQYAFNATWYLVFAIFGRLSLIKGIVYIWFPSFVDKKVKSRTKSLAMMRVV
ncbi:hypothetical protein KKG31_07295 [Patescibacteria group bacterium]|nr:hypothetical protein [Patescibacteria group bacterium]